MLKQKEQKEDRRQPRRKKPIVKGRRKAAEESYSLIWTLIEKSIPVKHLLILPGDCILPLSGMSMQNLMEDLYIKNSSVKNEGILELNLSRKVRPFRDIAQLVPLLERIRSPYVPKIKNLLLNEYCDYIGRKRQQRLEVAPESRIRASEYQASLLAYIKSLPENFYRYQLRGANADMQMQIKKVGFSQSLIELLYPEPTDILVQSTPVIFSNLDSYIKYMYYNLLSLVKGGIMDWIEIELQTVDDITISTRFKNIYFSSPASDHLTTITLFEVSQNAIDSLNYIRQQSTCKNILTKVNLEAQRFFNKFYSTKETQPKQMCGYTSIGSINC